MPPVPPLSGNLDENSLPRILNHLHEIKATGTLSLTREGVIKKLFIKNGGIIFASSSYEGDRLGEVLLKAGKINLSHYETASKVMKQMTGKRMGGVLVELGYLKPRDLFWGVKHQVQEIVSSLFGWTDGEYQMVPGEPPAGEVITLHMSTANLILHGIKRIDDWTRISRGVPPMDSVLALTTNPLKLYQDINLTGDEKHLFSLFDGSKSIKDALSESGLGDFEALKAVYVFYSIGMLEERGDSAPGTERPSASALELGTDDALDRTSIHKAYIDSKVQNHYELLGVDSEATIDEITAAYRRLSRLYHSDQHYREGMEQLKGELEELFGKVKEAYVILSDDSRRWEYDLSLATVMGGRSGTIPRPAEANDAVLAKEEFAKGVASFKEKDFEAATTQFTEATRLDPSVAAYFSHLALALIQRPRREAEAEEAMLAAIAVEPENADHRANLGLLYQKAGMKDKAKEAFAEALRLDPENQKALKALKP